MNRKQKSNKKHKMRLLTTTTTCYYCGIECTEGWTDTTATVDHIHCRMFPRLYSNKARNVRLSCRRCNQDKNTNELKMSPNENLLHELRDKTILNNAISFLSGKI